MRSFLVIPECSAFCGVGMLCTFQRSHGLIRSFPLHVIAVKRPVLTLSWIIGSFPTTALSNSSVRSTKPTATLTFTGAPVLHVIFGYPNSFLKTLTRNKNRLSLYSSRYSHCLREGILLNFILPKTNSKRRMNNNKKQVQVSRAKVSWQMSQCPSASVMAPH